MSLAGDLNFVTRSSSTGNGKGQRSIAIVCFDDPEEGLPALLDAVRESRKATAGESAAQTRSLAKVREVDSGPRADVEVADSGGDLA